MNESIRCQPHLSLAPETIEHAHDRAARTPPPSRRLGRSPARLAFLLALVAELAPAAAAKRSLPTLARSLLLRRPEADDTPADPRAYEPEQTVLPASVLEREDKIGVTVRELKDQTREAIEYFGTERVPAALIAGATLGMLFAYPLARGDAPLAALSKRIYMLLATTSICNTLCSVFAASLAIVRLLGHEHEPMAKDPLVMMLREVPLFFLAVRVHYLTGLLTFVSALAVRMFTDYLPGSPTFAKGLVCLCCATLLYMLALFNSTLIHFASFGHLWGQYARVLVARLQSRATAHGRAAGPVAWTAAALLCASIVCFATSFHKYVGILRVAPRRR